MGVLLGLACAAHAQLDLSQLYTQTVKTGQPWANINTKVDSLSLNISVNRGVVTTVATLAYTPGKGLINERCKLERVCTQSIPPVCKDVCIPTGQEVYLDSLETTAWFQAADNTVLSEMHLWVGDVKVRAELQERALASAQYEDIVKRRKDPALLETWGNGSYSLRIFPNQSGQKRKIEIEFVQGMENSGPLFRTVLPILHRLAKIASNGAVDFSSLPNRSIGTVTLTAVSLDGKTYSLKWPGLGEGSVGAAPLEWKATQVEELAEGILSEPLAACADCLEAWTSDRAGVSYFGVKGLLEAKKLKFNPEPAERIVLVDVEEGMDANIPDRARKIALLSLQAYAKAPYLGNLGFSDGKGKITYVFNAPVSMDDANLTLAAAALKAWQPSKQADYGATLNAFASERGKTKAACVAILLNNTPYLDYSRIEPPPPYGDKGAWDARYARAQAFETALQAKSDSIAQNLKAAGTMLFGFWNEYRIGRIAEATGGLMLGGLNGWIYPPYYGHGIIMDDAQTGGGIKPDAWKPALPPLFGPMRPDAYAIQDLQVTPAGMAVDKLVVLQSQRYSLWYMRGGGIMADVMPGAYGARDSVDLRMSGQYQGSGKVTLAVSGRWGGLGFTREFTAELAAGQGAGARGAGLWAYQQTEDWGRDALPDDIKAMAKLARDHHIVNRQMSLLALEPGVELWKELPSREAAKTRGVGADKAGGSLIAASGVNLDQITLEDILAGKVSGIRPVTPAAEQGALTVRQAAGSVRFAWSPPAAAAKVRFRVLDVSGRLLAELPVTRSGSDFTAEWRNPQGRGTFILSAHAGRLSLVRKFATLP